MRTWTSPRTSLCRGGWSAKCTTRLYTDPQHTVIDGSAADHVVEITGGSMATLDALTLTNGQSDKGGGVYVSGSSPILNNVVVTANVVTPTTGWSYGAGVYVYNGTVTLMGCEISHNTGEGSEGCGGGGLAVAGWGTGAVIEATQIMSNSPSGSGQLHGGGMWLDPGTEVTFEGTENLIAYNEATYAGGVYMWGNTDLQGVVLLGNHASHTGGGIVVSSYYSGGKIANNYLLYNKADVDAASLLTLDLDMEIANNTIVGDFYGSGAGVHVYPGGSGALELTNNIVVNHTVGIEKESAASVTLVNNDVWGNTTNYVGLSLGSGDISADPEFVDPDNDDYHLVADSPCVNAGEYIDWLFFDYDGDRRTGRLLDIGADEYGSDQLSFVPAALKRYTP